MRKRFYTAMACYAAIALLATFTLDGRWREAIWILMAGFAARTLIHYKARE